MTKQLRKRIMIILILLLSITFIAIITAINIGLNKGNRDQASESLQFLLQREGRPNDMPEMSPNGEDPGANRENMSNNEDPVANRPGSVTPPDKKSDSDESTSASSTDGGSDSDDSVSASTADGESDSAKTTPPSTDSAEKKDSTTPPEIPSNDMHAPDRRTELATSHYILAKYSKDKELESISNTLSDSYSDEDIESFCNQILEKGKSEGTVEQLRFMVRENKDSIIIAFIDHSSAVASSRTLLIISVAAGVIAIAFFILLSYVLSGWLVRPVEEAFTKQKQFISDASHELKTPITVILSNSELLEDQIGENKQLSYIKKECDQMHYLVTSLLTLTRLEQTPYKDVEKNDFCVSDAVLERIMPMESVAFEKGVMMDYDNVTPNLHLFGVKEQIGQVAAILIDNAITHTDSGGTITISLWKTPHHIHLTVANTGKEIPADERERLFERFYRADESRHRASGHFGLGLSIAKTIVTNHKGKISVDCADGITTFAVNIKTV